jgi:spore germination protein GerM
MRQTSTPFAFKPWFALRGAGYAICLLALMGLLTACSGTTSSTGETVSTPTATAIPIPTATPRAGSTGSSGYPVKVYFSKHPDSDNDFSKVFAVNRLSPTLGVATFAINQLIAGPIASERASGLYTELTSALSGPSNCDGATFQITLDHKGHTPETGTVTIQFCKAMSTAGIGTDARIQAQISKTLLQFPNNHKVIILTRDGHCFGDESGADMCLS